MLLVKTTDELQDQIGKQRKNGSIGFVPTMGALHKGHLSLVELAVKNNTFAVVSIFVNPTQFNDPVDLKRYPRNLEADLKQLESTGCHVVFAPDASEIYPEPDKRQFDFGLLEQVMEGMHRPGHFNGVAQVVSRLFEIVKPDKAYFGLKDFQQLSIIKALVRQLNLPVEIIPCPIIREQSGLAMSSRNELLSADERRNAAVIYKTLNEAKKLKGEKTVQELENWVRDCINKTPFLNVEYFKVVDNENLLPVNNWNDKGEKTGCIAVHCGKVRLIDNINLN
jgi:pantoate--beta-alanine ligase